MITDSIKALYYRFRHLILYGIIGGLCSGLDFVVYSLLCHYEVIPYLWANVISIHIGIFTSFALNRSVNFKVKDKTSRRFLTFYIVGLTGLGISTLLLWIMVDTAHWNEILCKLITIIAVALVQFILNKYITFKTINR
ncbi:MAG: GtrA family protein [Paludibacteraceae bacterium]|nr:GtrA family protein [Paludibacteraceae bacterium]